MTISSTNRKAGPFTGNGVTTAFPFTFKVFTAADILAVTAVLATGVQTALALSTDYAVVLNADQDNNPGGTLNMVVAPTALQSLTITSAIGLLQQVVLTNLGGFYPSVINAALDRLTIFTQQLQEQVSRSLKLALSTSSSIVPTVTASAGGVLIWDGAGQNIITTPQATLAANLVYNNAAYQAALATSLAAGTLAYTGTTAAFSGNVTALGYLFGPATNAYPFLKRVGSTLAVRLADDSGDANLTAKAGTFSGQLQGLGTSTNDNASAGQIGELLPQTLAQGSAVALTTNIATNITSLLLSAGDWDVWGTLATAPVAGTSITNITGTLSLTSGTHPAAPNGGAYILLVAPFTVSQPQILPVGTARISLSAATTIYLVATVGFSGGTCGGYGFIGARRAR